MQASTSKIAKKKSITHPFGKSIDSYLKEKRKEEKIREKNWGTKDVSLSGLNL